MSDNQNLNDRNEGGGLFSDEYEAPKRENPYLKKNREKAKEEKSKRDKPVRRDETTLHPVSDTPMEAKNLQPAAEEGTYVRKRTFSDWMFEHVKLVATIATIIVVLSLVLVTDVVGLVENLITQSQQEDREEMTLTYVQGLSKESPPIPWSAVSKFRRDESKAQDSLTWMIPIEGGQYELWISGVDTDKAPTYVYLFDMKTGDKMILGEDDFDAFIREHTKK